ncbi:hypothetical protein C8R42DRAFT_679026 [Lentinula raphanica]|nr:hypothetical protein C8R42DRAFT_679026 [Lentinula raphanica]
MLQNYLSPLETSSDEDPSLKLTALVTSAVNDEDPEFSLSSIVEYLEGSGEDASGYLDALSLLTLLLPSPDPGSDRLLDLIQEKCSSKETMIASAENLERIHRLVVLDEEQEESSDDPSGEAGEPTGRKEVPISIQVLRLVRTFSVISKIPFRRKSASDTIQSFIPELQSTIHILGSRTRFSKSTGREVLWHCAALVDTIMDWVEQKEGVKGEEIEACKDILRPFISTIIDSLAYCIQASLAKRAFKQCFPRLGLRETLDEGWERGNDSIQKATSCYTRVGGYLSTRRPSETTFILTAHSLLPQNTPPRLSTYFPFIIGSIQANTLLDESLAFLLISFSPSPTPHHNVIHPESQLIPLLTVLPSLSSAHPDPFIRHCTFRILGLALHVAPGPLQMQALKDLLGDTSDQAQQMRVAAVSLVKDAILSALAEVESSTSKTGSGGINILASPRFLQTFAPVLFVVNPPELFSVSEGKQAPTVRELEEDRMNTELLRLAEVLSLYYVLVMRDTKNRTGIRDRDNRANIERILLAPMRAAIAKWIEAVEEELSKKELVKEEERSAEAEGLQGTKQKGEAGVGPRAGSSNTYPSLPHSHPHSHSRGGSHDSIHSHALVPLISLQMGLERIDSMWARI